MASEERRNSFLESLEEDMPAYLSEIEKEAGKTSIPIIRRQTGSLLRFLLKKECPTKILEVGTAVGFSTLWMCEYAPQGCHITTIENYEKRIPLAKENFKRSGKEGNITFLEGDAGEILPSLEGQFDMIFMDAAKGQYLGWLPDCLRLLRKGGLLISDNVMQEGDVLESRYAVRRRDRTIHSRMREYLYEIKHHPLLETTILPIGDGVTVSVKLGLDEEKK